MLSLCARQIKGFTAIAFTIMEILDKDTEETPILYSQDGEQKQTRHASVVLETMEGRCFEFYTVISLEAICN